MRQKCFGIYCLPTADEYSPEGGIPGRHADEGQLEDTVLFCGLLHAPLPPPPQQRQQLREFVVMSVIWMSRWTPAFDSSFPWSHSRLNDPFIPDDDDKCSRKRAKRRDQRLTKHQVSCFSTLASTRTTFCSRPLVRTSKKNDWSIAHWECARECTMSACSHIVFQTNTRALSLTHTDERSNHKCPMPSSNNPSTSLPSFLSGVQIEIVGVIVKSSSDPNDSPPETDEPDVDAQPTSPQRWIHTRRYINVSNVIGYLCTCTCKHVYVCMCMCVCLCVRVCVHKHAWERKSVHVCVRACECK